MTDLLPDILADIEALVRCESPSADLAALAASADVIARIGSRRLGAAPDRIVASGRPHLRWRFGDGPPRVLLLCHHDTVWPVGTLARIPFGVTGGVLRGPGCFDMKAGLVLGLHAVAALADRSGVSILVTADEEIGSPSSRALIEAEAAGCAAVLVLEASADGGALKTERKGTSLYQIRVIGRAAHAGLEPENGVNATVEFDRAARLAAALGLPPLARAAVGGGSDGNFTAGIGVPTLDGLGAVGGGAHADEEHVLVDSLAPRAALLTTLIADLLAGGG
ncbi:MAG: M20/M25/M40 family metallo-hydrolase [Streptosporangiaceae bacterium]